MWCWSWCKLDELCSKFILLVHPSFLVGHPPHVSKKTSWIWISICFNLCSVSSFLTSTSFRTASASSCWLLIKLSWFSTPYFSYSSSCISWLLSIKLLSCLAICSYSLLMTSLLFLTSLCTASLIRFFSRLLNSSYWMIFFHWLSFSCFCSLRWLWSDFMIVFD